MSDFEKTDQAELYVSILYLDSVGYFQHLNRNVSHLLLLYLTLFLLFYYFCNTLQCFVL